MGIVIKNFAEPEFWLSIHMTPDNFASLTVGNFLRDNLLPVTIGNIIGGLLVGLPFWFIHLRNKTPHQTPTVAVTRANVHIGVVSENQSTSDAA